MSDTAPNGGSLPDFKGVRWTTLDLEGFADQYRTVVVSRLEATGRDPNERPPHAWFREQGLRAFLAALRRHHSLSFSEFWTDILDGNADDGYGWATDDPATVDALETFLDRRRERHDLSDASIAAKRRRLNLYVRAYAEENGTDDLLALVARETDAPAYRAVDACYAAFDHLNGLDYSGRYLRRVRGLVDEWYGHLVGRRLAGINPATGLHAEFRWTVEDGDPSALTAEHVRALMAAAASNRDRLLIVALAAWGLRANEVASLHVNQIERPDEGDENDVPHVRFEERKNGPGEVSILFGLDILDERITELADDDWAGHLFPSGQSASGHVTRGTVWSWFRNLAETAAVPESIDGARPSPQLCRRFWYDSYTAVLGPVLEMVGEVAGEQGSSDPKVVVENYLQDERARKLRREFMRERLAEAFNQGQRSTDRYSRIE